MSQRELPDEHACDGRVLERRPVFFFFQLLFSSRSVFVLCECYAISLFFFFYLSPPFFSSRS